MSKFKFFASKPELSQMERYLIRGLSGLSDEEVKKRVVQGEMLFDMNLEFPFYGDEWKNSKEDLLDVVDGIENTKYPLQIWFRGQQVQNRTEVLELIDQVKKELIDTDISNQICDGEIESEDEYEMPEGFDT